MSEIFEIVYRALKWLSSITGLTYREINILVYYFFLPIVFVYQIGRMIKKKYLVAGFVIILAVILLIIPDFEIFSHNLFNKSVVFLKWFDVVGLNYVQTSVVICVLLPLLLFGVLWYLVKRNKEGK